MVLDKNEQVTGIKSVTHAYTLLIPKPGPEVGEYSLYELQLDVASELNNVKFYPFLTRWCCV